MRSVRNNLLAGSLVLGCLVAALAIVITLAGAFEELGTRRYIVRFRVADGVPGLVKGSKVSVGGLNAGTVHAVMYAPAPGGAIQEILVACSVDDSITLRQGAVAMLVTPLLGGSSLINFTNVGEGPELDANQPIPGSIAPPSMLAQAGYGPDQQRQLQSILQRADDITARAKEATTDFQEMLADARRRSPDWYNRFDSITKNVDEAAAKGPQIADSALARLDQLKEFVQTGQGVLNENRANVKDTLANAKSISERGEAFMKRLNEELTGLAKKFLEDGQGALASGRAAIEKLDSLVGEQMPNLRRTLANLRLSSDQLTATMAEVRSAPWRLIYRPDKRELDFELLYDSARVYAGAVSDLRAAGESIQSVVGAGAPEKPSALSGPDRERLAPLLESLDSSFTRYKSAEEEFLRQMMLRGQKK